MNPIEEIYSKYILGLNTLSRRELNNISAELYLLGLALYLKNLTKDPRSLYQLKEIIQEEFNLYGRYNRI